MKTSLENALKVKAKYLACSFIKNNSLQQPSKEDMMLLVEDLLPVITLITETTHINRNDREEIIGKKLSEFYGKQSFIEYKAKYGWNEA